MSLVTWKCHQFPSRSPVAQALREIGGLFLTFSVVFLAVVVIYKPTRGRGPQVEKGTKMQKLTYRNEDQLLDDAVKMLLERHLSWSGSNDSMPSRDIDNVRG